MKLRDWLSTTDTTHAVFAERLGVARETVSRWASEAIVPDWKMVIEIEDATLQAVTASDWATAKRERA
jgi:DNA-binding XRE family transcriptional regulator